MLKQLRPVLSLLAGVSLLLLGSGLLNTLGIHHKSKYNAFCLADDLMEPYRPYIDYLVYEIYNQGRNKIDKLTPTIKSQLLNIYNVDVNIEGKTKNYLSKFQLK